MQINADQLHKAAACLRAYAAWQEAQAASMGTLVQQRQHADGALLEDELLALARAELFRGFDTIACQRWRMMTSNHLPRHSDCDHPSVDWTTADPAALSGAEWVRMEQITRTANDAARHAWIVDSPHGVRVQAKLHRGKCRFCDTMIASATALVTIPWATRTLSREYSL